MIDHPFYSDTPEIPLELTPQDFLRDNSFCNDTTGLWWQILLEICHPEYATRSHANVGTYDQGCRGPLCRKALREHPRRRSPDATLNAKLALYDPILEYFHVIAKRRVAAYKAELTLKLEHMGASS